MPAGDVTIARSASGSRPVWVSRRGRAAHRLDDEGAADLAGQAHLHPGLHQSFGHEEQVGRSPAREAGHRIEQALGQAHDRAHGREHVLGPGQVVGGGEGTARHRRHPGPDQGRGVGHGPHDGGLAAQGSLQAAPVGMPATMESSRVTPHTPRARQAPSAASGLTASTAPPSPASSSSPVQGRPRRAARGVRRRARPSARRRARSPRCRRRRSIPPAAARPAVAPPVFPPPTMSRLATRPTIQSPAPGRCRRRDSPADSRPALPPAGPATVRGRVGQRHRRREVLVGVEHRQPAMRSSSSSSTRRAGTLPTR